MYTGTMYNVQWTHTALSMCKEYAEYADVALTIPQSTALWIHQRDKMAKLVQSMLPASELQLRSLLQHYLFMCDHMSVSAEDVALAKEMLMWKRRMNASRVEHGRLMRRKRTVLEDTLKVRDYVTIATYVIRCIVYTSFIIYKLWLNYCHYRVMWLFYLIK